jgi:hypothetical protein
MAATWALVQFSARTCDIKLIAPDAVERHLAAFDFEPVMLPAIVIEPKPQESHGDYGAVKSGDDGKIEHDGRINKNAPKLNFDAC